MQMPPPYPVVIFDGYCELCNQSVDFILKREKSHRLRFTANQNEPGKEILDHFGISSEEVKTIFLAENGRIYQRSRAALRIARYLKFPWNLLYGLIVIPGFLRDVVYKWISRNRYRWFGKKDTCRIPTEEEKARFLL